VVLDTETTGISWRDEIIELALVEFETEDTLISVRMKPGCNMSAKAEKVHGISMADLKYELTFPELYEEIAGFMTGMIMMGYNVNFDGAKLSYMCEKHRLAFPDVVMWIDAMRPASQLTGIWNSSRRDFDFVKLKTLAGALGIDSPTEGLHTAVGDCLRTIQAIKHIASLPTAWNI
jgi:DNA polymerase-3 subunit epsilon